jgi:hypothetical protein
LKTKLELAKHGFWKVTKGKKDCLISAIAINKEDNFSRLKKIGCTEEELIRVENAVYAVQREPLNKQELEFLSSPSLFKMLTEDELNKKIVGEMETRKTIFLVACGGRLVENAKATSSNLMVNAESSAGKDHVVRSVIELLPNNAWLSRTRISPTAFTYWHSAQLEPEWDWNKYAVYLEDISNGVLNCDVFKTMASGGSKSTVVINQKAVDIEINGKPALIITTASANPKKETTRRFPIANLDETENQTSAIIQCDAENASKGLTTEYNEKASECLQKLKQVKVKIHFAPAIAKKFPAGHVFMRTHFSRFLDYIKFATAIHQYQRDVDEDGFYIAEQQDYEIAKIALKKTTSNPMMIPLTKNQQRILNVLKEIAKECFQPVKEIEKHLPMSDKWLREQLDILTDFGLVKKDSVRNEETKRDLIAYSLADIDEIQNLPTWEEIKRAKK